MKKLIALLIGIMILALCSSAPAATVLSDEDLGELYAGHSQLPVYVEPVAEQTNIAALIALGEGKGEGDITMAHVDQKNLASVCGFFAAKLTAHAVGPQKNIAAIFANDGDIFMAGVDQDNAAKVEGGVVATGMKVGFGRYHQTIPGYAVAIQKQENIAALIAKDGSSFGGRGGYHGNGGGDIIGASVEQGNKAKVRGIVAGTNYAKAVERQLNIAALVAEDDIEMARIAQKNKASVSGKVDAARKVLYVGAQSNIAALFAKDSISGACVRQTNSARVNSGMMMGGPVKGIR